MAPAGDCAPSIGTRGYLEGAGRPFSGTQAEQVVCLASRQPMRRIAPVERLRASRIQSDPTVLVSGRIRSNRL